MHPASRALYGPLVKWLRHGPFTAVTAVRICYGSPHRAHDFMRPAAYGGLAQLVRARASHARGHAFESHSLHHAAASVSLRRFFCKKREKALDKATFICYSSICSAGVAHLVERHLAKVEVASSSLVARSIKEENVPEKPPTMAGRRLRIEKRWEGVALGHAFSLVKSSFRGMKPSPSYWMWICCLRLPLDLSGAST